MDTDYSGPVSALDRQGMANLKRIAGSQDRQALSQVAKQFESLFLEMVMKDMRSTVPEGGLLDSSQVKAWQSMHDQQLAINLSGGLGIAEMLERQLGRGDPPEAASHFPLSPRTDPRAYSAFSGIQKDAGESDSARLGPRSSFARFIEGTGRVATAQLEHPEPIENRTVGRQGLAEDRLDGTPANFVKTLWDTARKYAPQLGLDPVFVLGQAALETGWGGKLIRHRDGRNSHNLFGIKAGSEWQGERVRVRTLEYTDGVMQQRLEPFRSYASFDEAFADYANLLQKPRYREVVAAGSDLRAFARGLQASGYATDPNYGHKIMQTVQRANLQAEVLRIKEGSQS